MGSKRPLSRPESVWLFAPLYYVQNEGGAIVTQRTLHRSRNRREPFWSRHQLASSSPISRWPNRACPCRPAPRIAEKYLLNARRQLLLRPRRSTSQLRCLTLREAWEDLGGESRHDLLLRAKDLSRDGVAQVQHSVLQNRCRLGISEARGFLLWASMLRLGGNGER
jgi:hypothetical protein